MTERVCIIGLDEPEYVEIGDRLDVPVVAHDMAPPITVRDDFGLAIIANDDIVRPDDTKHLLEVNNIPNVTRFPEIWEAYRDFAIQWIQTEQM